VNPAGQIAVVAGGASGLGEAAAIALRDAGATVVVLDIAVPSEDRKQQGMHYQEADVRDPDQVAAAIEYAASLGELRIAASCAGVGSVGRITRKGVPLDLAEFQRVIDINLVGTFNVLRLASTAMAENEPVDGERGVLVTTASAAAFEGQIGQCAYSASKGGIVGMTLPIARDLAQSQIRCVTIAPGLFDTPLLGVLPPAARQALERTIPNPSRLGRPSEFGSLVLQVVENPMINGETLRIDGALRMAPR
jgi:NAD(P)-dependent dehydrogenase (short-subunit alcohol dehydrogenase family)